MSKAVLISIRPEWCRAIIEGRKTVEVRKTKPKNNLGNMEAKKKNRGYIG